MGTFDLREAAAEHVGNPTIGGDDGADLPNAGDLAKFRAVDRPHVPAVRGVELDAHGQFGRTEKHAAEIQLRAGRSGVLGAIADPHIGDAPVSHDRIPQVTAAPDEVGFGVGLAGKLGQADACLAGAAQVDHEELKRARLLRALAAVGGPGGRVGKSDGDVEPDGRIDLRFGPHAGRQVKALHQRRLKFPGEFVVGDADRGLQNPLHVHSGPRLVDRGEPRVLFRRELFDVLLRYEHPWRDLVARSVEMLIELGDVGRVERLAAERDDCSGENRNEQPGHRATRSVSHESIPPGWMKHRLRENHRARLLSSCGQRGGFGRLGGLGRKASLPIDGQHDRIDARADAQ